jgi:hypothetical protein
MPEGMGSAMVATIGTVAVAALQLKASLDETRNDDIGFCARYLLAELQKMFLPSLARVSCHDQINSLDVTKAAQLFEKRGVVWIAPTFAHVSNGGRGVNEGDAVRLSSLLCSRRERPSSG